MEKFRKFLVILAVISLSNAHLALMQGITWVEMAANAASDTAAFLPALAESIKPETKCDRCCAIEESHQQQQDRSIQWESKLIGAIARPNWFSIPVLQEIPTRIDAYRSAPSVAYVPETPPPRFV